jgi:uncharacterized lipoprotein YajG
MVVGRVYYSGAFQFAGWRTEQVLGERRKPSAVLCILVALTMSACAWTPKELELTAQPRVKESTVGSGTVLFFRFIDDRDDLTVGHRSVATVGAKITAEQLPQYVEARLRDGLLKKGYLLTDNESVAQSSVVYRLRAFKFYLEAGFFTAGENKSAAMSADARRADKTYSNVYRFSDEDRDIFVPGGQELDDEMNEALASVLTAALNDEKLDKFLTGTEN